MKPSAELALAREFEALAVATSSFSASTLWITRAAPERAVQAALVLRYETALQKESRDGFFHLTESEFEKAFELLVSSEGELAELDADIALSRVVKIDAWRINDVAVPTSSRIHWDFGSSPGISTFLRFGERNEFDYIRSVFERLRICRLNEKHLKPVRR